MSEYAWFDLGNGREVYRKVQDRTAARSDLPTPHVISDSVEVKSMVDGQMYSSKRALRRSYRERGYVEVGDQEQKLPPKAPPDRKGIRDSIEKAFSQAGISA